jgi:hypothetical protein
MTVQNPVIQHEELFSYVVASGDMRFIEIGERDLYLRRDPKLGPVIRGEVPECGPECYANLSQVFLEYVMGCEDCREAGRTAIAADNFGRRLGRELIALRYQGSGAKSGVDALADANAIVLNSLGAPVESERSHDTLYYRLAFCPFHATAKKAALNLWTALAHRTFVALLETLLELAPGWTLRMPVERESDAPLSEVIFTRA